VAKRRCKGAYVRIELPDKRTTLPENTADLLKEAADFAILRAHSIWKMSEQNKRGWITYIQISEETFREDRERFQEIAEENVGLYHLLLSVFFTKIHQEMEPRASAHKIRTRNAYLSAGMAQREISSACLCLSEESARTIPQMKSETFGIDPHIWLTGFIGGRSVARVIAAFMNRGAEIFFPTAYIDIQGRIDLLVRFPVNSLGLCVQIKTFQNLNHIRYRLIPEVPYHQIKELSEDDQYFLKGVTEFRSDNIGMWFPLEIMIGDASYTQRYIDPPRNITYAFDRMLMDLFEHAKEFATP